MNSITRLAAGAAGAVLLAGVATAAAADEVEGTGDVDVTVEITEPTGPGALALSVGGTATSLTEDGTDATARVFTGTLPTVTVTDTRSSEEIPDGAAWYVVGTTTDFTAGGEVVGAENLGWTPRLLADPGTGTVGVGDDVEPALDGGPGLVDREFLAYSSTSAEAAPDGQWTATADLTLKTPTTVAPGTYTATVTLSLFE